MLVLALAAQSTAVAWGFGAAGFLAIIGCFLGICVCLCIYMMRNADPKVCVWCVVCGVWCVCERERERECVCVSDMYVCMYVCVNIYMRIYRWLRITDYKCRSI
jgi:hypothetical protein